MKRHWFIIMLLVLLSVFVIGNIPAYAAPKPERGLEAKVILHDPEILARTRQEEARDPVLQASVSQLTNKANAMLSVQPVSVTEKTQLPPGGTLHDYVSLAPYWWPNPNTPNGLPYIQKDGQTNPAAVCKPGPSCGFPDKYLFQQVLEPDVYTLSLAYYFSGDKTYAAKAADFLRVWFLNSATAMNPNLNFGQMVLGVSNGRAEGIIDWRDVVQMVDAIGLLQNSPSWSMKDQRGMENWFSQYLNWLQTSPIGQAEAATLNNHSTWYDTQTATIALFTGKFFLARQILQAAGNNHMDAQHLLADGSQPQELIRTLSWHYSVFNLQAFVRLAMLGDKVGVNLWNFKNTVGAGLQTALSLLLPAALGQSSWPFQQISPLNPGELSEVLYQVAAHYHNATYLQDAKTIEGSATGSSLNNLLYGDRV